MSKATVNRYAAIIERIFLQHYRKGIRSFKFSREDLRTAANALKIKLPDNLGDLLYSFKYRSKLPDSISRTAPAKMEWIIGGAGRSQYEFRLSKIQSIAPRENLIVVKIPDATPEIISAYALGDEQAVLAKIRYNRLIDVFLGIAASSLQNHLRTTVAGIGQIEIDELYVGVDRNGSQYVIPVQAKGGSDRHGRQQTEQDIACCAQKFAHLKCRPVSAQSMSETKIALFELAIQDEDLKIVSEVHYELVPASSISSDDLEMYARRAL